MPMKYTSARERAEKQALGSIGTFLKLPNGVKLWKPKEGIHTIDILPYEAGRGNPFADPGMIHWERTFYAHRGIGANSDTFLCPRESTKTRCPVCEHRAKLRRAGDSTDEEEIKALAPKERQIFNVIDRRNPDDGIQLWTTSYFCFGKVLDARLRAADDRDGWDEFFHLKNGFSLRISLIEEKMGGYGFMKCDSIDFKPRDKDLSDKILDEVFCLDDILIVPTTEVLEKAYLEIRDTDDGESKPERKEERSERRSERTEEKPTRRREPEPEPEPEEKPKSRRTEPEPEEKPRRRSEPEEETKSERKPKNWDDFDKKDDDEPKEEEKPRKRREPEPESEEKPARRRSEPEPEPEPEEKPKARRGREPEPEPEPEEKPKVRGEEPRKSRKNDDW